MEVYMGRPKGSLSKISKIQYPRKCNHCEYMSNTPQMYFYHKQTHEPIPANTYCHFGCGNVALVKNTGGKYTCFKKWSNCPEYINQLSSRTKNSWKDADNRKEKTRETFLQHCCGQPGPLAKMKKTKRKKSGLLTPLIAKDYRHYARAIRKKAQHWAKEQGYVLGQQTYHVDHKFSILDAWHADLAEAIVNHPSNLQILDAKLNSGKGSKSSITLEELLYNISQADAPA